MHKTVVAVVLAIYLLVTAVPTGRAAPPDLGLEGTSVVLLHADSRRVLYAKDAYRMMYPASTTKVLTALLTLEQGRLNDTVVVGQEVLLTPEDGSLLEIEPGDRISVRDLLHGLMLCSGNDAAYTLAVYVGRRVSGEPRKDEVQAVERFVRLMNERAREIGALNTHFANPDGYHDPNHWTTAYDLALIAREAMQNALLRKIVTTTSYRPSTWHKPGEEEWKSGNRLLDETKEYHLPGVTGLKPGYTPEAGFCQVTTATRKGLNLIGVVLKSGNKGRWIDSAALMEWGFASFECVRVARTGQPLTTASIGRPLISAAQVVPAKDVILAVERGKGTTIQREVQWLETAVSQTKGSLRLQVPARRSLVVGKAVYRLEGEQLAQVELVLGRFQAGWLRYVLIGSTWLLLAGVIIVWVERR